ncbi:MAG TPA: hypothetical protein DEG17_26605 [Cyanobacteria bacterium UBA11149]|nr:hypothetical protein [Cyanobacteria bacterium UBA11366]HBK62457.1 hypothetical protein [Cyanobacteria bacterium UBA11166]HBR72603.1 hypothetical protein [Cyanobacteria bacterium UBA11159]HBS71174.1 hypothetical protein [Cyanobacteria bacterium UBA11153]HBW92340.1 hypothetical protein [Cyanobacteria bacterium UBA11149]HCA96374.1 hypothetical protein [Cyanobacteria bacterium UBA9226]
MVSYAKNKTKFSQLLPESIWLEAEDFEEAVKISKRVTDEAHQWQIYLNSLALIGFERWVKQRYPDLSVNRDSCSLFESVNMTEAVCNLKVGEFKVCLLVVEELGDKVLVPKVVVDLPDLVGHFYVVVEVLEEEERVILRGFLQYDELVNARSAVNLEAGGEGGYQLPLSLFDSEMNHLLFYSRYLAPSAILLPVDSGNTSEIDNHTENTPQIDDYSSNTPGIDKETENRSQMDDSQAELRPSLVKQVINVALWLGGEIDELTRNLGWGLPAPLVAAAASGFRYTQSFDTAIAQLRERGINIPPQASGNCRKIYLGEIHLEILAGIWALPPTSDESIPRWSLLLILGRESGGFLPKGIRLQVKDINSVLYNKVLETDDCYMVVRLSANLDEQFTATIELQGKELELGTFAFNPNQIPGTIQTNWSGFRSI